MSGSPRSHQPLGRTHSAHAGSVRTRLHPVIRPQHLESTTPWARITIIPRGGPAKKQSEGKLWPVGLSDTSSSTVDRLRKADPRSLACGCTARTHARTAPRPNPRRNLGCRRCWWSVLVPARARAVVAGEWDPDIASSNAAKADKAPRRKSAFERSPDDTPLDTVLAGQPDTIACRCRFARAAAAAARATGISSSNWARAGTSRFHTLAFFRILPRHTARRSRPCRPLHASPSRSTSHPGPAELVSAARCTSSSSPDPDKAHRRILACECKVRRNRFDILAHDHRRTSSSTRNFPHSRSRHSHCRGRRPPTARALVPSRRIHRPRVRTPLGGSRSMFRR